MEFFRKIIRNALLSLNIIAVLWLAVCYAASVISPEKVPYLALFSLTTLPAVLVNFGFVLLWIFSGNKWRAVLSAAALLILGDLAHTVFGLHFWRSNQIAKTPASIKVMTWNVHGLGLYDRPIDKNRADNILAFIAQEKPDIVCLNEFLTDCQNVFKPYAGRLFREGGFQEYRFVPEDNLSEKIQVGTAFFSKFPLANLQAIPLAAYIKVMQCDVALPDHKKMRTFFTHLQSYFLQDKEKALLEAVKHGNQTLEAVPSKSLIKRFDRAYKKRAAQADSLARCIAQSPYPALVCGDMNDMPGSYTYHTVKGKLKDAFAEKGRFFGRTYNLLLPTLRIDYIFYDPALLHIIGFRSPFLPALSDHSPVIANFELK
jgi:endonuclease/exonuclease/phosphatase family metal-dependent hydrolase